MGRLASLFFPFWCLDAKGGDVALFRLLPGFAWDGHKPFVFFCIFLLVSALFSICFFAFELCWFGCETIHMCV